MYSNADTIQVVLEGPLVIRNAKSIKDELMAALTGPQNIVLVLRHVTKIDLTIIQLLLALQKSATRLGRNVSYNTDLPDPIKSMINHSGLAEILI